MKTKHLKAAAAAVSLLIASGPAVAISTGPETLGPSPVALDAFTFSCPLGAASARANVVDTNFPFFNAPARMRVILTKLAPVPPVAPQAEDVVPAATGGEGNLLTPSLTVAVFGGAGPYRAMFLKTAAGFDSYVGNITCHDIFGVAINPAFIPVLPAVPQQNQ